MICRTSSRAGAALLFAASCLVPPGTIQAATDNPFGPTWPEGAGRELTGAWCGGCHSLNLVQQQGMSRARWDEMLHWMSEKQNMPPLKGEMRDQVLDYLAANFGAGRTLVTDGDQTFGTLDPVQGVRLEPLEILPQGG